MCAESHDSTVLDRELDEEKSRGSSGSRIRFFPTSLD
jgi:hypothetical protein